MDRRIRRHTLGDVLRRTAARMPARPAIVCGDVSWTYAEFDAVCNRLAHGLAARGLRTGDRLALLSRNSHRFAAIRFAVARLGAVLVPVNFMLTAEEVAYVLRHSGARILCVADEFASVARDAVASSAVETVILLDGDASAEWPGWIPFEQVSTADTEEPVVDLDTGALAQIIYTSGTESRPKGAMLTHDAVLWQYVSCIIDAEIGADDVLLHALPLYHCAQLDVFLGPAVYVGASNVIVAHPQPEVVLPMIARHRVTSFFAPPTVWIALLRTPLFDTTDVSSLRKGYYGAAIMPVEVLNELGRRLPQVRFWNLYGQTEIAPLATVLKPDDQIRKAGSAGHPALLRLLGVPRRRVILNVFAEGVLIALVGVVFGVLLAVVSQGGFNRFFQWRYDTPLVFVRITAPVIWRSVAYAVPLGLAAAVVSAWLLLRRDVLTLFRR